MKTFLTLIPTLQSWKTLTDLRFETGLKILLSHLSFSISKSGLKANKGTFRLKLEAMYDQAQPLPNRQAEKA